MGARSQKVQASRTNTSRFTIQVEPASSLFDVCFQRVLGALLKVSLLTTARNALLFGAPDCCPSPDEHHSWGYSVGPNCMINCLYLAFTGLDARCIHP